MRIVSVRRRSDGQTGKSKMLSSKSEMWTSLKEKVRKKLKMLPRRMLRKVEGQLSLAIQVAQLDNNISATAVPIGHFGLGADIVCGVARLRASTEGRLRRGRSSKEKVACPRSLSTIVF